MVTKKRKCFVSYVLINFKEKYSPFLHGTRPKRAEKRSQV